MSNAKNRPKAPKSGASRFLTVVLAVVIAASAAINVYGAYDLFWRKIDSANTEAVRNRTEENDLSEEDAEGLREAEKEEIAEEEKRVSGRKTFSPIWMDDLTGAFAEEGSDGDGDADSSLPDGTDPGEDEPLVTAVTDQTSAKEVLNSLSYELGIKDPESEYSVAEVREQEDTNYFVMRQYFNGIEVVGGDLIMQADKADGTLVNIGGKHLPIPDDLDTEMTISYDEANEIARKCATVNCVVSGRDMRIDNRGVKIYNPRKDVYTACYEVVISDPYGLSVTIAVDGKTGNVVYISSPKHDAMVYCGEDPETHVDSSLQGQAGDQSLYIDYESENRYYLRDTDRRINIRVNDRKRSTVTWDEFYKTEISSFNPNDEDASKRTPDKSGVDALANLQRVYDFYKEVFDRSGITSGQDLDVYVGFNVIKNDDGKDDENHNNAAMYGDKFIVIGTNDSQEFSSSLDVIAHEFTHGIIYSSSGLGSGNEQNAINEGLADVFAELAEDFNDDGKLNKSADFSIVGRTFSKPLMDDYTKYSSASTESHDASSFVSGPFYKMLDAPNDAVNELTLAKLYYKIIPSLGYSTTIDELRYLIENTALKMNFDSYTSYGAESPLITDRNMEVIIDAFDEFGIPSQCTTRVVKGGKIKVYDKNKKLYDNYNVRIYRPFETKRKSFLFEQDVKTPDGFELPGDLGAGYYKVLLTDLANKKNQMSFTILVNDNAEKQKVKPYKKTLHILTNFDSEEKDVVLVLDNSGSMDGAPISQARSSAKSFVQTVLKSNPTTKISLISYNSGVTTRVRGSSNKSRLMSSISSIRTSGRTNTYDALAAAKSILDASKSKSKLVVLLSDGLPNEGPNDNGDYYAPIYRLIEEMQQNNIVYSLGFFHNLSGSELGDGQKLMSKIATEGYDYVVDNADSTSGGKSDLENVFSDFAEMVNGKKFINVRIACPVDVSVTFNGETLSSDLKHPITRTSFGTLSYEKVIDEETGQETDDPVKILRLEEGTDFEICMNGTGKGKMNYTISYPDENGEYTDVREFKRVPITKDTVMAATTKKEDTSVLKVDTDGDGTFDLNYEAENDKPAEEISGSGMMKVILILVNSLGAAVILAYLILMLIRKSQEKKAAAAPAPCTNCGAPIAGGFKFCRSCGTPVPAAAPQPEQPQAPKASKAPVIVKIVAAAVFVCFTSISLGYYFSNASAVFRQIRDGQTESAKLIYKNYEDGSGISDSFLATLTNHHLSKAEKAYGSGELSEAEYRTLLTGVEGLGVDDITDNAKEKLEALDKAEAEAETSEDTPKEDTAPESAAEAAPESAPETEA